MEMRVTTYHGRSIISLLRVCGKLDATSYLDLIEKGKQIFAEGVRQVVLDLGEVTYISSAGLMALHALVVLLQGGTPPDPEAGWSALYASADDMPQSSHPHLKLLNPQGQVLKTLARVQFTAFLDVYTSLDDALGAFLPPADRRDQSQRQLRYMQALNPDLSRKPGSTGES